MMELHVISAPYQTINDLEKQWTRLYPWVEAFHLRYKEKTKEEVWQLARHLLRDTPIPAKSLVINSHADLAETLGAGGLHLPEKYPVSGKRLARLKKKMRVGRSVHSLESAIKAEREGMDYILVGHIFPSASKPGLTPLGADCLQEFVKVCSVPVIAIGGIEPQNLDRIKATGIQGVAVISAVTNHTHPEQVAIEMKRRWNFAT